jgi:hypothetical protein
VNADFLEHDWGKRATVLRGELLLDQAETFALLQRASEAFRAGKEAQVRFFIGHANLVSDIGSHLPRADEPSLEAYADRVRAAVGTFGVVVNFVHLFDWELTRKLRSFAQPIIQRVGLPTAQAHAVLFLGDYDTTPFRVHKDRANVFSFVLHGRKRIRVWPYEVFKYHGLPAGSSNPVVDLADYEDFLDRSEVIEGGPGDILYWPASHWHIAESTGGLAASISLGFAEDPRQVARVLGETVEQFVAERLPEAPRDPEAGLPAAYTGAIARVRELDLAASLQRRWMERVSASGFRLAPPPPAAPLGDMVTAEFPIVCAQVGERLLCAANGVSIEVDPALRPTIDALNSGAPVAVTAHARAFLEWCHVHRVV